MTLTGSLIEDLERAVTAGGETHRVAMLTQVTDLFFACASRYSAEQIHLFDEVIAKLVEAIEPMARAKLASRLAGARNAPVGVVRKLAFDDNIEVAGPVLRQSECLNDSDLVANANSKSQQHLVAIAHRKNLSEAVTDVLVTRGDREVVHSVSKNHSARISYAGFRMLLKRAVGDDKLALLVGTRADLPQQHFLRLIEQTSAAVRDKLLAENLCGDLVVEGVVSEISTGLRNDAQTLSANYAAALASVEIMHRAGRLGEAEVRHFARDGRLAEIAVALSLICGVESDVVERALLAPGSDILVILAKLAGFSWNTAKMILVMKAGARGLSDQELEHAAASFDRLQAATARDVLGFYRARTSAA
jgi:uncharacterized protein (DUF2336 family)